MGDKIIKKKGPFRKLKVTAIVIALFAVAFFGYVEIVNRNSTDMTYRQKILKAIYPVIMWGSKISGKNSKKMTNIKAVPPVSFYSLKATLNNGETLDFASLRGKKVMIVNTASDCGFTGQYEGLQSLYQKHKDDLVIVGFPANDFKEQEKGNDAEIAQFCKINFGVTFPLVKKSIVIKDPAQNEVYKWLTEKTKNGWNNDVPTWNFSKYLIDEEGKLTNFFGPSVDPGSTEVANAINQK